MNSKQWNATMFSAMLALAVIAVPFFAVAGNFDFGMVESDFGLVFEDNLGNVEGVVDGDFGIVNGDDIGVVSGFDSGTGDINTAFDTDLGPFDAIDGNIPGDDVIHPSGDNWPPVTPPVAPETNPETPTPSSPESEDYLSIFIHSIFVNSAYGELAGSTVPLIVTFENTGTKKLENTKVIVMIPDLSVRASVGPLYLGAGKKATSTMFLDLPEDTAPGIYPVRIQIYNENTNRIVHREIEVIDY